MKITTEYIENIGQIVYPQVLVFNPIPNQDSPDTSYFRKHKKTVTIDCPSINYQKFKCTDEEW